MHIMALVEVPKTSEWSCFLPPKDAAGPMVFRQNLWRCYSRASLQHLDVSMFFGNPATSS